MEVFKESPAGSVPEETLNTFVPEPPDVAIVIAEMAWPNVALSPEEGVVIAKLLGVENDVAALEAVPL